MAASVAGATASHPEYRKFRTASRPSGVSAGRLTAGADRSAVVSPNSAQKYGLELRSSLLTFCSSDRLTAGPACFAAPGTAFFSSGVWAAALGGSSGD
ncbi:hypothetical protein EYF80_051072 [Liparis tanakae]|uniref:Uncharacterized protein n=1 Tax=Liparis tanakae TaxID=230148 RepID=A0A4Z2FCY7_9TELE|nr:hypothetical protein EYF80_051072 [Liparis tanakae]